MQQGVNVWGISAKNNLNDQSDRLVVLWGASTANTANSTAQTATISVTNLFQNSSISAVVNSVTAQTVTSNTLVANTITANSYNMFFGQPLITVNFSLSAAQIANCSANLVTIIPAQGANTIIFPIAIWGSSTVGNPWSSTGQLGFWLANTSTSITDDGTIAAIVTANNYFGAGIMYAFGSVPTLTGAALVFGSNNASPPSGGNVSISGVLQYIVLPNMP